MTKLSEFNKGMIEKALDFQNKNWHKRALKVLHEVEEKEKTLSMIYGLMGRSYYEVGDYDNSAKHFKKCLKLKPTSELASLGLFHSLIHIGKIKPAFVEMKRYLNNNKAKFYKVLIKELEENKGFSKYYPLEKINSN